MDRDRSENVVDPVERVSPSTGNDDTGTVDTESADIHADRRKRGTEPRRTQRAPHDPEHTQPGKQEG